MMKSRAIAGDSLRMASFIWRHQANRRRRVAKLLDAATFQFRSRVLGLPSVAKLGDHSYLLAEPRVWASTKVLFANPPDWPEMQCWRRYLRPGDLFVDVGANVGTYSIWALDAGAEVIALEPDPSACLRLRRNLGLNGYTAEVWEAAAVATPGPVTLTFGLDDENRLLLADDPDRPSQTVSGVTLDEVIGDRSVRGAKIDVEGAELLVLQGAERSLSERRIGLLQLEWNNRSSMFFNSTRDEVEKLLTSHGYRLWRADGDGALVPLSGDDVLDDLFATYE
jgi:FkbM family methyltransferase